jgi:hypothetical protein
MSSSGFRSSATKSAEPPGANARDPRQGALSGKYDPARHTAGGIGLERARGERQLIVPQCSVQIANTAPTEYTFANNVRPSELKHPPAHSLEV